MTIADLTAGASEGPPLQATRPTVARGKVLSSPASATDDLHIVLPNYSQTFEYVVESERWSQSGGELPVAGDACVAVFDDNGDVWVNRWSADLAHGKKTVPQVLEGVLLGMFQDFATGVPDAPIAERDMGTPTRADSVFIGTSAALTYAAPSIFAGILPKVGRLVVTGGSAAYLTIIHTRPTKWNYHGRIYAGITSTSLGGSIRLVEWLEGNSARCRFQLLSNRKVEIRSGTDVLLATSQTVLAANTPYRFEWHVALGAAGNVTLKIYVGQSTKPIETLVSSAANTGTRITSTRYGNANNGNFSPAELRFGGFAEGLRDPVGPYFGPPDPVFVVRDPDTGLPLGGFTHDGRFFVCATRTIQYDSNRQKIYPGDIIFTVDPSGTILYGLNRNVTKPPKKGPPSFFEGYHIPSGRAHSWSSNIQTVGDPPDLTFQRSETTAPERGGTDGQVLAQGTFRSGAADFTPIDRGRVITITLSGQPATDYWIRDIVDQQTVQLEDVDDNPVVLSPTQTGATWAMVGYPFPRELSGGRGAIGQLRTKPIGYPFIRDHAGTNDGSVPIGTPTRFDATSGAFTTADVGRGIMLGDDPLRVYEIIARIGPTSVTLDRPDTAPGSTGLAWSICGGPNDEGVEIQFNPQTFGFRLLSGVQVFDTLQTKVVAKDGSARVAIANPGIFQGGANNFATRDIWEWFANGDGKLYFGDFIADAPGKGVLLKQPNGLATKKLTIDDTGALLVGGVAVGGGGGTSVVERTHVQRLTDTPTAGLLVRESDTGLIYRGTGSGWAIWKSEGTLRKTADQTLTQSSTTAQNLTDLVWPVEANEVWFFQAILDLSAPSNVADMKFDFAPLTGATVKLQRGTDTAGLAAGGAPGAVATNIVVGLVNGEIIARVEGLILVGGTAGNAQLRAAQNTSTAEDDKVLANSILLIRRLA